MGFVDRFTWRLIGIGLTQFGTNKAVVQSRAYAIRPCNGLILQQIAFSGITPIRRKGRYVGEEKSSFFWSTVEGGYAVVSDEQARVGEEAKPITPQELITFLDVEIAQPRVEQIRQILDVVVGVERINFWFEGLPEIGIFSLLASCRSLREIGVYDDENALTVEHFAEIAQLSSLHKLYLGCANLSKAMFAPLAEMKHLEAFSLEESEGVEPEILYLLPRMQGLRELSLELNDTMVKELALSMDALSRLKSLSLDYSGLDFDIFLGESLAFLRKMPELQTLSFRRWSLDASHAADLVRCESIENLKMDHCEWKKGAFERCASMPNLRKLEVVLMPDAERVDWHFLEQIPNLTEFSSWFTEIPTTLTRALPHLRKLQRLEMTGGIDEKEKQQLLAALPSHVETVFAFEKKGTSIWLKWLVQFGTIGLTFGAGYALLSAVGKLTEGWLIGLFLLALVAGAAAENALTD